MTFIYSDTEPKGRGFSGSMPPPVACYATHYSNYLYLRLITVNGTDEDKRQARKEIDICQRKMDYHRKRPGWTAEEAATRCAEMRRQWNVPTTEALP